MDKEELIGEKKQLENLKKSLKTIKSYLSNPDINDKLSKVVYNLSKDYLIDDKNNKLDGINSVMSSREVRINVCDDIINAINVKLRDLAKKIDSLDSVI